MKKKKAEIQQKEYEVIQEKVMPKKKTGPKEVGLWLLRLLTIGAVVGISFGVMLALTERFMLRKFGIEGTVNKILGICRSYTSESETAGKQVTPVPTKDPVKNKISDGQISPSREIENLNQFFSGVSEIAERVEKSLVKVYTVTEDVDWFGATYEANKEVSGLYLGSNADAYLFLVSKDSIEESSSFLVELGEGLAAGELYCVDSNYHMAVVSVAKALVKAETVEKTLTPVTFAKHEVVSGDPLLLLGKPNGNAGGMEFGMVTGSNGRVSVIDDVVGYFTTNISQYAESDGFAFNLDGEVFGMSGTSLNNGETGVFTAIFLDGLVDEIERMMSNGKRIYCGIGFESLEDGRRARYSLPNGVYVTEVLADSPALIAGLQKGDIILKVGAEEIKSVEDFRTAISGATPGTMYILRISREVSGQREEREVRLVPDVKGSR